MNLLRDVVLTVIGYLRADWLVLLLGVMVAAAVNVYVEPEKMKRLLRAKAGLSIPGAVAFGALTPLCACGTMAVMISMFVTAMPWGPVMAFLVSSPLTSPSEYLFEAAFLGPKFATAVALASVILGLSSGFAAHLLETRTRFFKGQLRLAGEQETAATCCGSELAQPEVSCCAATREQATCCSSLESTTSVSFVKQYRIDRLLDQVVSLGLKKILPYFILFIAVGRVVELSIPKSWINLLFSGSKAYSIPLSATIGLPLYVSNSAALPLLRSLANSGAGEGAILAFLITGKATGIPVIAGMSTFLKPRVIAFYVALVYVGGVAAGYAYQYLISII